jgi:hypothetical protein
MAEDTDSSVIKNPTMSDLHKAAEALDEVFSNSNIKYAICEGFLAILLGINGGKCILKLVAGKT